MGVGTPDPRTVAPCGPFGILCNSLMISSILIRVAKGSDHFYSFMAKICVILV